MGEESSQIMKIWVKTQILHGNRNTDLHDNRSRSDIMVFLAMPKERRRDYANVAAVEENKSCAIAREKSFHQRDFHKKFGLKYIATIGALRIY